MKKLYFAAASAVFLVIVFLSVGLIGEIGDRVKNPQKYEKNTTDSHEDSHIAEKPKTEDFFHAEKNPVESVSETDEEAAFIIEDGVLMDYVGNQSYVVIPDNVKKINEAAFWSKDSIEGVVISGSVTEIGDYAFWSCDALRYVHFEEGVQKIGDTVFWSCPSLKDVNLPTSIKEIGNDAFANCDALTLHVPSSSYAQSYVNQNRLTHDNVYAEYTEISGKIINPGQYSYGTFTEFEIENDISFIGARAFEYCERLTSIEIPSSVQSIGGQAFAYCDALSLVTIHEGCEEIGDRVFEYCPRLSDIYLPSSVKNIEPRSFSYCSTDLTLHVPKGSYAEQYAIEHNIPYVNDYNG